MSRAWHHRAEAELVRGAARKRVAARPHLVPVVLALPLDRTDLLSLLHRTSLVIDVAYEDSHVNVVALVSSKVYARVEPFLVRRDPELQPA